MKHSIICFISLMMTVFCYARTSIYQLPSDSTDWKVYYMQGEEYHRKGKLQKSLSNYKKALSIHVSDTIVHALANCYYQRGYYQQSIELYNTFIKKDSSETKLNTIAKCYDKLEKTDSALIYRKIIAMQDIENQNNTIALAQNLLSMEQPDSALIYLCRYTSIDSTDLNINRLKAYAYNQAGLHQDAIKLYQKIRQSGDRQASTEYYLGLSYAYTDSLSRDIRRGIYTFRFDQHSGKSMPLDTFAMDNPSFLTLSEDGNTVYAVSEMPEENAAIYALKLDRSNGRLQLLDAQRTGSANPCHVCVKGKMALVSNYTGGTLSLFPLNDDGSPAPVAANYKGGTGGPDTIRQPVPHIHCSQPSPDGKYVFASDFSADRLLRLPMTPDGKGLMPADTAFAVEPDSGPRHFIFSPDGEHLYLLGELSGKVTVFRYDNGILSHQQTVAGVPRTAQIRHRLTEDVCLHQFRIALKTACCNDDGFGRADIKRLAAALGLNADDFAAFEDKPARRRTQMNSNAASLNRSSQYAKEPVAALFSRHAANGKFAHALGSGQRLVAGMPIDTNLGFWLQSLNIIQKLHRLIAKNLQQFRVPLRMRQLIQAFEVGVVRLLVRRNHEASRGNSHIAAAFGHLFQNHHRSTCIVRSDGRICAGVSVTKDDNVGRFVPFDVVDLIDGQSLRRGS